MYGCIRRGGVLFYVLLFILSNAKGVNPAANQGVIDRGVAYLKRLQRLDGTWPFPHRETGITALAGLALLESGVPAKDPAVQKAVAVVRTGSIRLTDTYSLSTAVLFLDRYGDPLDEPLIDAMVVRLLAGQDRDGGWTYICPSLHVDEIHRLREFLTDIRESNDAVGGRNIGNLNAFSVQVQERMRQIAQKVKIGSQLHKLGTDKSNTLFATLALWAGRRHRMPVDRALVAADHCFRKRQMADGAWQYVEPPHMGGPYRAANTCAGLLALGMGHAVSAALPPKPGISGKNKKRREFGHDRAVRAGFRALAGMIGEPAGTSAGRLPLLPAGKTNAYYFLWALNRVAVAYDLQTIGNKDWYAWGSQLLLVNRARDGGWHGYWQMGGADTCFALLFLCQSNLTKDLTAKLKTEVQGLGQLAGPAGNGKGLNIQALKPRLTAQSQQDDHSVHSRGSSGTKPKALPSAVPEKVDADALATRLAGQLVKASGGRQATLIEQFQRKKGMQYTQALAVAIPQLKGEAREKTRDALAERLTRMTAATLHAYLQEDDRELRSAAALAAAMKEDTSFIPDLIGLFHDSDSRVRRAAYVGLKSLTGQDFGPPKQATPAEYSTAAARWQAWWQQQPHP